LEKGSETEKNILKKFNADNVLILVKKFETIGEQQLNPNDFYYLLYSISNTLLYYEYYTDAVRYSQECVVLTRKIYSEDLSNSLAKYKTKQAVKEKDLQIKAEKEQKKLYLIISSLVIGLLVVSVFLIIRIKKQSNVLELKNDQINKTLKEKELLVREVHHRVKNNFQIVASLLELQSKGIEDEKALALANEGKNRVKSMALIHQKLYQTDDGLINFDEYITLLIKEISSLFASNKDIEITINSKNMFFDVDTAIPLGLIVNELITNAYKYAFTENDKHYNLNVSITKESDFYKLVVSDNGKGFIKTLDVKKIKSLGLRLVSRLTRQLQGKFEINNKDGATVTILFKDARSRKEID
jgi:two-component sensor histidine kinase